MPSAIALRESLPFSFSSGDCVVDAVLNPPAIRK